MRRDAHQSCNRSSGCALHLNCQSYCPSTTASEINAIRSAITSASCSGGRRQKLRGGRVGDSLAHTARPLLCGRIRGSHRLARPAPRRWLQRKHGVDTAPGSAPPRRPASRTGHAQHRPALAPVGGKRRTPAARRRRSPRCPGLAEAARPR